MKKLLWTVLHLHTGSWCAYVEDSFPVGADRQTLSPQSNAAFAIVLRRKDLPIVQKNELYNNFEVDYMYKILKNIYSWHCNLKRHDVCKFLTKKVETKNWNCSKWYENVRKGLRKYNSYASYQYIILDNCILYIDIQK